MNEPTGSLQSSRRCSPWLRARKPAGIAFGVGFLLGATSVGGVPRMDLSPESLAALALGLAGGLLGASAVYAVAVFVCSAPWAPLDPGAAIELPPKLRAQACEEKGAAWFFFVTLVLTVGLFEVLKYAY